MHVGRQREAEKKVKFGWPQQFQQSMSLNKHKPTMSATREHVDCLSHYMYTTARVWCIHHNTLSILVCSFLHMGALKPRP
jgi:hypothetical protein